MQITPLCIAIGAICAWREARGGGQIGMQSVLNVLANRARRDNSDIYSEAVKRLQFSSLSSPGDPELTLWPATSDPQMASALAMAEQAAAGSLVDLTNGATLYYNPAGIGPTPLTWQKPDGTKVAFPAKWNPVGLTQTAEIAHHIFFTEEA